MNSIGLFAFLQYSIIDLAFHSVQVYNYIHSYASEWQGKAAVYVWSAFHVEAKWNVLSPFLHKMSTHGDTWLIKPLLSITRVVRSFEAS